MNKESVLILHNVRSAHNVGALFRTADGAGVTKIFLTGYTPTPHDGKAVYQSAAQKMIAKTALGAQDTISWEHKEKISNVIAELHKENFTIVALEQTPESVDYKSFTPTFPLALIVGNEPKGLDDRTVAKCDHVIDIPMRGTKESLNVSVAGGIALFELMAEK